MQRFIFGLVAATFISLGIFGLAQALIQPAYTAPCVDCNPVVQLDPVFRGRPPEEKPRRPEPPEKPAEPQKPASSLAPQQPATRVAPPRIDSSLLTMSGTGVALGGVDVSAGAGSTGLVVTRRVEPQYPASALRRGVEGEVEVEFTVQPDGSVTDIRIISATPRGVFEQSVRRAVARWGFKPRQQDGRAQATRVRQVLSFKLPDQ